MGGGGGGSSDAYLSYINIPQHWLMKVSKAMVNGVVCFSKVYGFILLCSWLRFQTYCFNFTLNKKQEKNKGKKRKQIKTSDSGLW